ncbi:MAG TPA: choice-of-anchor D domain-containing protein, partial [Kiritimatiellia bacterium]|nr:choice-of-anchor D domain-containing protein [Kiritimatiellia bacterium]
MNKNTVQDEARASTQHHIAREASPPKKFQTLELFASPFSKHWKFGAVITIFAFTFILLPLGALAQQTIYNRNDSGTGFWWHGNLPWWYSSWGNQNRPDNDGRGNVNYDHNNNNPDTVNGAWFNLRTLTFLTGAGARTFNKDGDAGISLTVGLYNNASGTKTFNVPIGVDAGTVAFEANNGDLSFTDAFYLNGNIAAFAGSNNNTVSGVMSGSGGRFTKAGTGTLFLSGNNSFTGASTISAGAVRISHANALGTTAGNTTVASGAALELSGGINSPEPLSIAGTGISSGGAINNVSGNNTLSGTIAMTANSSIGAASATTLTAGGIISGGFTLTKAAGGTLILTGNNTYSGGTTHGAASPSQISIGHNNALGTGAISWSANNNIDTHGGDRTIPNNITLGASPTFVGSHNLTVNGTVAIAANRTLNVTANTLALAGNISGAGVLTKGGNGTMTLSGNNSHAGTTLSAGTLNINSATALGTASGTFTISGVSTINNTSGGAVTTSNHPQNWNANFTFTGSNPLNLGTGNVTLGANRTVTVSASTLTVGGAISGAFSLTKAGAGTMVLSGNNTYSAGTTISAGTLQIGAGSTSGSVAGNIVNNAALVFDRSDALTYAGQISGSGTLTKNGAGTLTLSGTSSQSGATTVSAGALLVSGSLSSSAVTVNNAATIAGGGTIGALTMNNASAVVSPGNTSGAIGTLNVSGNASLRGTYTADITGTGSTDCDKIEATGSVSASAALTINLPVSTPSGFSVSSPYTWTIMSGSSANAANMTIGTKWTSSGTFSLQVSGGNTIQVVYTPPAEGDVEVRGNNVAIADGDTTPSTADHTDFSDVLVAGGTLTRTFTVTNAGSASIGLGNVTVGAVTGPATNFIVTSQLPATLAAGGSTTFQVQFNPSQAGVITAELSFTNTVAGKNPYNFYVQGTGTYVEVAVSGNGNNIADGSSSPSLANHTDFGAVGTEGATLSRTYTITNSGNRVMTLGTVGVSGTHAANFTVTAQPPGTLNPSNSTTFTVQFDPSAVGLRTAELSFSNNDDNFADGLSENPFNFAIQGTGVAPAITNWPMTLNFSSVLGTAPSAQNFYVTNSALGTMAYTVSSNFTWLSLSPASGSVGAGAGATHSAVPVVLAGQQAGTSNATITIGSATATNAPKTISVQWTISAIPNPSSGTATADGNELVRLAWTKNTYNVMVVHRAGAAPTAPVQGTAYAVGDSVGGGTVLYNGPDASGTLEHEATPGVTHYYTFYSENYSYYSEGIATSVALGSYGSGVMFEPFGYTNSTSLDFNGKNGGVGWTSTWSLTTGGGAEWSVRRNDDTDSNRPMFFDAASNQVAISGNRAFLNAMGADRWGIATRGIPNVNSGVIYVSALIAYRYEETFEQSRRWATIAIMDGTDEHLEFGKVFGENRRFSIRRGGSNASSSYNINPYQNSTNNWYWIVLKYDFAAQQARVKAFYRSENIPGSEPSSWDATWGSLSLGQINRIRLKAGSNEDWIGGALFDQIRVATNWSQLIGGLDAPTGLSASDGSSEAHVALSWDDIAGETGYLIWRHTANTFGSASAIFTNAANTVTYNDTSATPGQLYYYWITATNASFASEPSASDSGFRKLAAPASVAASDGTSDAHVTVTWGNVTGETGFGIWRHTADVPGSATYVGAVGADVLTFNDTTAAAGTLYYYWVRATNSTSISQSDFSASDSGFRGLTAPASLTASDGTSEAHVALSWGNVAGETGFGIWRNTANNSGTATYLASVGADVLTYNDTGATPGQQYYYWVRATNSTLQTQSAFSNGDGGFRKLAAPTGVAASDGSSAAHVTVTWNNVTGETGFSIWRHTSDSSGSATYVGAVGADVLTFNDTSADPGILYYYWVRATNSTSTSQSDFSGSNSGFRNLAAPASVAASDGTSADHVTITWGNVAGETGFSIWRHTSDSSGSATYVGAVGADVLTYNDTTAVAGTLYYYWVRATNSSLVTQSAFSSSDSGYRGLSAPGSVAASDGTSVDHVTITWADVTGETGFSIWRHTSDVSGSASYVGAVGANVTTFNDTTATAGTLYYYWVRATNSTLVTQSAFSSSDSGFRQMAAPGSVAATDGAHLDKVTVTWADVTGETGFAIWRNTTDNSGSASYLGVVAANTTTYDDTTANPGQLYFYWVRATNSTLETQSAFSASDAGYRRLPTVAGVSATDSTFADKVVITWTDSNNGETGYTVWRNTVDNTAGATLISGAALGPNVTSYEDTTGTQEVTYYYWVRATNDTSASMSDFGTSDAGTRAATVVSVWAGLGANGNWGTTANWSDNAVPASTATARFYQAISSGTNININTTYSVGGLDFLNTAVTALNFTNTSALTIGGAGITTHASGSGAHVFRHPIVLGANQTWTHNNADDLSFFGVISGSGSLVKEGSGRIILTNNNSYTGLTTINNGIVRIQQTNGLGTIDGATIIASGGALEFSGAFTPVHETLTISGSGVSSGGALRNVTANNRTLGGTITLAGDTLVNLDANATLTFSNTVDLANNTLSLIGAGSLTPSLVLVNGNKATGDGAIYKNNAGNLTLSVANTMTGTINLVNGTIIIGNNNGLGPSGLINIHDGTTLRGNSGTRRVTPKRSVLHGDFTLGYASGLMTMSGTMNLGGEMRAITSLAVGTNIISGIISNGGLIKQGAAPLALSGANTYDMGTRIDDGELHIGIGSTAGAITGAITNNAVLVFNRSNALTHSDVISGTGSVVKLANGTITLSGNNSYSGATTISAGGIRLSHANALGTTAGNTVVEAGATLESSINGQSYAENLVLNGTGTNGVGALFNSANEVTFSGNISLASDTAIGALGVMNLSGEISGAYELMKVGSGRVILTGANNYSGGTVVDEGILQGSTTSLQGAITVEDTLVFDQSTDGTYAGALSGPGIINKIGAGSLTLSGTSTFNSDFNISNGTVVVSGSVADAGFRVYSGTTLRGNGTVGALTVSGTVAPGNSASAIGGLDVASLVMNNGSTARFKIGNAANTADRDFINNAGSVTINATVTVAIDSSQISNWNSANEYNWNLIVGGISSAANFTLDETSWASAKNGGVFSLSASGGNLVLTFTPMPATQAHTITLSSRTQTSLTINWSNGNGSHRLVVAREASAVNADPVNNNTYTANTVFGSGSQIGTGNWVVFAGTGGGPITVTGLKTNTSYHFRVYEYYTSAVFVNYNTNTASGNPANFTTADIAPGIGVGSGLTVSTTVGTSPSAGSFAVTNVGGSSLSYVISTNASWLSVSPITATNRTSGQTQSHTVTYSVAGLHAGVSNATITITQTGAGENAATNSPQTINVQLTLTAIPDPTAVTVQGEAPEFTRLFWTKNASHDVMIIHRATNAPSVPVNGTSYNAGEAFGGDGSRVIYKGAAATFEHVVIPGTINHYAFYSINNNHYSTGVTGASTNPAYQNLVIEQFAYTNGLSLNNRGGGRNWTSNWEVTSGNYTISTTHFTQVSGYPAMGGNILVGTNSQAFRGINNVNSGKLYVSFKFRNDGGNTTQWSGFSFYNGATELKFVGESFSGDRGFTIGNNVLGTATLLPDTDYTIIAMHDFGANITYGNLYTNATQSVPAIEPVTWQLTHAGAMTQVNRIRLGGNVGMRWDEVRIATNYYELLDIVSTEPAVYVGPTNIALSVMKGNTASATFAVTNTGSSALLYTNTTTYGSGSGWLTVAPTGGTVNGGASRIHTGTVSAVNIAAGTYVATNRITGNQTNGAVDVVYTMTVTNIPPATSFTATADGNETVHLTIGSSLPVMIVYREGAEPSAHPTDNTSYPVTTALGGGTVIYQGSSAYFEHIVAPGQTHNYRVYAVNNNHYSTHLLATATTGNYGPEIIEPFAYTNGVNVLAGLSGGNGWSGAWSVGAGTWGVRTNFGSDSPAVPRFFNMPAYPNQAANRVRLTNPGDGLSGRAERSFPAVNSGTIYAAAIISYQFQGANKWAGISLMSNTTEKAFAGKVSDATEGRRLGVNGPNITKNVSSFEFNPFGGGSGDTGNVYLVVMRYNLDTRQLDAKGFYRTSTVPEVEPSSWDATSTAPVNEINSVNGIRIHAGAVAAPDGTIGDVFFDEIRVASSWSDLLKLQGVVATNYIAGNATNHVFDGQVAAGSFPFMVALRAEAGVNSSSTTPPFFLPNFDILNPNGVEIVTDRVFSAMSYQDSGKTLIASNTSFGFTVPQAAVMLGSYTGRWSAISSNGVPALNIAVLSNSTPIAFTVVDDDTTAPTLETIASPHNSASRNLHISLGSAQISTGSGSSTNITYTTTDAALTNLSGGNALVFWLGARDAGSGLSRDNTNPDINSSLSIGSAIVSNVTQWDSTRSSTFTNTYVASATNAWSWITPMLPAEIESLVLTGTNAVVATWRDADFDRPDDQSTLWNQQHGYLIVNDDDVDPPTIQNFDIRGVTGVNTVTVEELIFSLHWAITGRVHDASGINVNSTNTIQPNISPYFELWDPSGAMQLRQAFNQIPFSNGGATSATRISSSNNTTLVSAPTGIWTARVVVADADLEWPGDRAIGTNTFTFVVVAGDSFAGLEATPTLLTQTSQFGVVSGPTNFTVNNVGLGNLVFSASPSAGWLSASPSSTTVGTGNSTNINVTLNIGSLNPGTYEAVFTLSGNQTNGARYVTNRLTVVGFFASEIVDQFTNAVGSTLNNANSGTGWDGVWAVSGGNYTSHSGSLSVPVNYPAAAGNRMCADTMGTEVLAWRNFPAVTTGKIYAAYAFTRGTPPGNDYTNGYFGIHFFDNNTERVWGGKAGGSTKLGLDSGGFTGGTFDFYNGTYLLVIKYDFDAGDAGVYVRNSGDTMPTNEPSFTLTRSNPGIPRIDRIRISGQNVGTLCIDEVRVARTWANLLNFFENEPTLHASSMSFENITTNSMTVNWVNGNGVARIVVARTNGPVNFTPVDGVTYTANNSFAAGTDLGNGNRIVYNEAGNTVNVSGLNPATRYYFQVFEYNVSGGTPDYLTSGTPLAGDRWTLTTEPDGVPGSFSAIAASDVAISNLWTTASGASGYVIFRRPGAAVTNIPVDGFAFTDNQTIGDVTVRVVTPGSATALLHSSLASCSNYHFRIYAFNQAADPQTINYNLSSGPVADAQTGCGEPSVQASEIVFQNVGTDFIRLSWTLGSGTRSMVLARQGTSITADPVDGLSYTSSSTFASGTQIGTGNYVVYRGTNNVTTVSGLTIGQTYTFKVYTFNGSASSSDYNTNNAANNPRTTATAAFGVASDRFVWNYFGNYANNNLSGAGTGSGWSGNWSTFGGYGAVDDANSPNSFRGYPLDDRSNCGNNCDDSRQLKFVTEASPAFGATRSFATRNSGKIVASVKINIQSSFNVSAFAGMSFMDGSTEVGFLGKGWGVSSGLLTLQAGSVATNSALHTNTTWTLVGGDAYLIVMEYDFDAKVLKGRAYAENQLLHTDPDRELAWTTVLTNVNISQITGIRLAGQNVGDLIFDHIRISPSWEQTMWSLPDQWHENFGPTPSLVYIGTNYGPSFYSQVITNLSDAELKSASGIDFAVRWDAPSGFGIFLTNNTASTTNIGSNLGRVNPNWDPLAIGLTTNEFNLDRFFDNRFGFNGFSVVTTFQQNAFNIQDIDFEVQYFVTVSAEAAPSGAGTVTAPNGGNAVPTNRAITINHPLRFYVYDDDPDPPVRGDVPLNIKVNNQAAQSQDAGDGVRRFLITDRDLATHGMDLAIKAYDEYSGLQRANTGDPATNMNVTIPWLVESNISHYVASRSTTVSTNQNASNVWSFANSLFTYNTLTDMWGGDGSGAQGQDLPVNAFLADNDDDRANDQAFTNDFFGWLRVIDNDPTPPEVGAAGLKILAGTHQVATSNPTLLIAGWNFNDTANRLQVNHGAGTMSANLYTTNTTSGSSLNLVNADIPGQDWTIQGGTNVGRHLQFTISMKYYQSLVMTFAARRSGAGYNNNTIAYSVNGGGFVDFETGWNPTTNDTIKTVDLSAVSAVNDATSVTVRITFGGGSGGNNRFDNVQFNAQPVTYFEVTDRMLAQATNDANALAFSFNVFDEISGLSRGTVAGSNMHVSISGFATNDSARYSASRSSGDSTVNTSTSLWSFTSFGYNQIGDLYANGLSNRPIFASFSDADFDRANDNLWVSNRFFGLMRVIDNDTNAPFAPNVNIPGTSLNVPFAVTTNNYAPGDLIRGFLGRRDTSGGASNVLTRVTDADLANAASLGLEFRFSARDTHSGVSRGNSGTTNEVMSFSIGNVIVGNFSDYNSALSTPQTGTNQILTNVWTFGNFDGALINTMMTSAGSTGHPVRVTIPDADNDRPNDRSIVHSLHVGQLVVVDDDINGPVLSTMSVVQGNLSASLSTSFETNQGWASSFSSGVIWTNTDFDNRVWRGQGVTLTTLDPKVSGKARIGFLTNDFPVAALQLPPVDNPGALSLYASRVSGGSGAPALALDKWDGVNWINYDGRSILAEGFDDGDFTANPTWRFTGGNFIITTTPATNHIANNNSSTLNQYFTTEIAPVSLAEGETVSVMFTYELPTNSGQKVNSVRVGLFQGAAPTANGWNQWGAGQPTRDWRGYFAQLGVDNVEATRLVRNENTIDDHAFFSGTELGTGFSAMRQGIGPRTMRFDLTRLAGGNMQLQVFEGLSPGSLLSMGTATDTSALTNLSLNNIAFYFTTSDGLNGHIQYDNISVFTTRKPAAITVDSTDYQQFSWNIDTDGSGLRYRVRRADPSGVSRSQIYVDDLALTTLSGWIGTNALTNATIHMSWAPAIDDFSGVAYYGLVAPAQGSAAPAMGQGDIHGSSVTGASASILGHQGIITGFLYAVDNDNDRPGDQSMGNTMSFALRVDTNPPPPVAALRATDAAGGNVFDPTIDESSEIKVEWTPGGTNVAQAAGWRQSDNTPLSPWDTFIVTYYEVTDTNGIPAANAVTTTLTRANTTWSNVLNNWAFTNLVLSNLVFDTYYRIHIQGRDGAGNVGPAASIIGNTDRFIVTQGVARTSTDLLLRWTGPQEEDVFRDYDVLFTESSLGFRNSLSNQWQFMQYTNRPALLDHGGTNRVAPGNLTGTTYRFYRVA